MPFQTRFSERLGDAEIEHHGLVGFFADEDVCRFQITMHEFLVVRILHGPRDLDHDPQNAAHSLWFGKHGAFVGEARKITSGDVLHHEVRMSVVIASREDGDDVAVVETRQASQFMKEACVGVRARVLSGAQHYLEGNELPIEREILGEIDTPHAAASDLTKNLVRTDALSRFEGVAAAHSGGKTHWTARLP